MKANRAKPVKVERPDPVTGEVIEEQVPASRFKPKRLAIVSSSFKRKVLAGDRPGLIFPGGEPCPVEVGQEIPLTGNVSIRIDRITKTKGQDHRGRYTVCDFRPTFMRRTPKIHEAPELDADGYPIPHTKEAIEAARIDGNYTQDPNQAVPDSAPEVDIEYQRVLGVRRLERERESDPVKAAKGDARVLAQEMQELAVRAARMGLDSLSILAPIAAQISRANEEVTESRAT